MAKPVEVSSWNSVHVYSKLKRSLEKHYKSRSVSTWMGDLYKYDELKIYIYIYINDYDINDIDI